MRGEPGRVEKLRVEKEDCWPGRIETAHSARCGICDVPEGGVVIVGIGEVDERHFMDDSTREGDISTVLINENPRRGSGNNCFCFLSIPI